MIKKILFEVAGLFQTRKEKEVARQFAPKYSYRLTDLLFSKLYQTPTLGNGYGRQHYVVNKVVQVWVVFLVSTVAAALISIVWPYFWIVCAFASMMLMLASRNLCRLAMMDVAFGNRYMQPFVTAFAALGMTFLGTYNFLYQLAGPVVNDAFMAITLFGVMIVISIIPFVVVLILGVLAIILGATVISQ